MDEGRIAAATLHWLMDAGCSSLVSDSPASWLVQPPLPEPNETPRVTAEHLSSAGGRAPAERFGSREPEPRSPRPDLPDWTPQRATPVPQRTEVRTSMAPASVSVSAAAEEAARLAAGANTLEELFAAIENFEGLSLIHI